MMVVDFRERAEHILGNDAASLWDLGDGACLFEIHTKMNSFASGVFDVLEDSLALAGGRMTGLLLGNDHPRAFSVGADLSYFLNMIENGEFEAIETYLARGQRLMLAMKYCPVPVVAAIRGFALGGGCEFSMHANSAVVHEKARLGLPEFKVGLIPGWGGCTQLLLRGQEAGLAPEAAAERAFKTILEAELSGSAADAREMGLLRETDEIFENDDNVLPAGVDCLRTLIPSYAPSARSRIVAAGASAVDPLLASLPRSATETDREKARILAEVLCGGGLEAGATLSEQDVMDLERQAVLGLSHTDTTRDRMNHFMKTGQPLAN